MSGQPVQPALESAKVELGERAKRGLLAHLRGRQDNEVHQ